MRTAHLAEILASTDGGSVSSRRVIDRALPRGRASGFPVAARAALADPQLRHNLRVATHTIRDRRMRVVAEVEDWEQLREAGRRIKQQAVRHLDQHLEMLEASVMKAGGHVHWAADAAAANRIVGDLIAATGSRRSSRSSRS